ncbi:peptidase [Streptomyces xantholiticus]|uniref:peptidase n=1 Tax=Streptomyces xantholiticus TaxID=68285 RepID=UPI001E553128|nr:peptidase [Streptomyces xantholiticus]
MRVALGVLTAALVGMATPAVASPLEPSDPGYLGFRLLEAPVARRDDPRALKYIVDHLKPGTTIERRFEVANNSDDRREVRLYAAAAGIKENRFTFADGHTANELSEWTKVHPARQTLDPREKSEAVVTIKVPKDAAPGERYAVVWAEIGTPPDATHNIGSVTRVGVRVYLDVSESAEYAAFDIEKLTAIRSKEGRPSVIADVRNSGKRALDMKGKLHLSGGPAGLTAGSYPVITGTTLPPGGVGTVRIDLDQRLPSGPWTARLQLESGTVRRSLSARLTFPEPGGRSFAWLSDPSSGSLRYALTGVIVTLGAAVALLFVRQRRRGCA